MLDIDDHKDDPYLIDYTERRRQGTASSLDRANTAVLNASQAATLHSEEREFKGAIGKALERSIAAAAACAIAERQGDEALAEDFAKVAESEALVLDSFDHVRIEGMSRHQIHGA
jgi:hypothetical protein